MTRTRFAPAPTGHLHLGHVANAIHVWGMARRSERLRAPADRGPRPDRSRGPAFDEALLEDLAWLGFEADEGPVRQSDDDAPYAAALERLSAEHRVYECSCSRTTFADWAADRGRPWHGPGCPGDCRRRGRRRADAAGRAGRRVGALDGRARSGRARTRWRPPAATCRSATATATGPTASRWPSTTCAQSIDLVIRGRDLLAATAAQIRLARVARARDASGLRPPPPRPTARRRESCRRPMATPRSATCGRPDASRLSSSARRPRRSG